MIEQSLIQENLTQENLIQVRDVCKTFGSYLAVDRLSMNVRRGEIVVLLGQTGAGKSTVLNLIMGTTAPTSGEIRVAGFDPYTSFRALKGLLSVSFTANSTASNPNSVVNLITGFNATEDVSLNGSPTVSPTTVASCKGVPFCLYSTSTIFLALSQAAPAFAMKIA